MSVDISFDKIAHAYDGQRAHPAEVSAKIGPAIAHLAGNEAKVLELGVGTGRIALPCARAGLHVVGIDISREMLHVAEGRYQALRDSLAGSLTLIDGDIMALTFGDSTFDAVLAVHVLHLASDWRAALNEAWRVLRPGGVLIMGRDWRDPQSCGELLRGRLREAVMALVPGARPPGAGAAIPQALAKLGGITEPEVVAAEWTGQLSPAVVLAGMAQRADSETWALDDQTLEAAVSRVRAWAAANWDDLEAVQPIPQRFVLTVVRKPME